MKNTIRKIFGHRFVSATFWMYFSAFFLSGGTYLYHLLMGRMLGPFQYGILESMIALLYILGIPLMTLTLVIVKFSSTYKGTGNFEAITGLYDFAKGRLLLYGSAASLLLLLLSPFVKGFLKLPSYEFNFLLVGAFFFGLFNMFNKAMLQGLIRFFPLAISNLSETIVKLSTALLLVLVGFKALGAFASILVATLVGYFVAKYFLSKLLTVKGEFTAQKELFVFSIPVLLMNLGFISLFTTDILLVRHFFSGIESGYYAALSVLGKVLFFAASPISYVMFPLVSEHHASKKQYSHFLFLSLALTVIILLLLTLSYFLLPHLMVRLLFGDNYLKIASLLGYFAIFISLYTISSLLANFYLSIHKVKIIILVVLAAILQIILIVFLHSSLLEVVKVSIITTFLLLLGLMLYYPYAKAKI